MWGKARVKSASQTSTNDFYQKYLTQTSNLQTLKEKKTKNKQTLNLSWEAAEKTYTQYPEKYQRVVK